jgi:glycosyltransferase involved in cell wall biosynthesis
MRVLDVGCHDGFVGMFLLHEWDRVKQGEQLDVDGLELHPRGVAEARRRGYRIVKQGAAEEADQLFMPGTYDAVVAYELLEHVPDMNATLAVLERLLTDDGVIYVSTPDGTFGNGGNPHHLRALRSIDLAELLRRRGVLQNMGVGEDTICVGAYKPHGRCCFPSCRCEYSHRGDCPRDRPLGELVIHTGPGWERWSPLDIDQKGLGGSETAAVKLADALSDEGWTVTVYGDVDQGVHRNVVYRHHETFDPLERRDVFIASRYPELFDRPVNAHRRMLWLHDTDCGDRLTPERARQVDHVLALSGWHQMNLITHYPFLGDRVEIIRNGISLDRFQVSETRKHRRAKRLLYTSSPDRGLDVLLELWPRIRKRAPGATFEHTYAPVYQRIAAQDPALAAFHERVQKLSEQKGVVALGSLSQPALAQRMLESLVWCAPSYNGNIGAPFYETSCIGAMEAQAAGLHVVASAWGALTETVILGDLIDEEPNTDEWRARLVDAIVEGLTSPQAQHHAQLVGPQVTAHLGWGPVASHVTELADVAAREELVTAR